MPVHLRSVSASDLRERHSTAVEALGEGLLEQGLVRVTDGVNTSLLQEVRRIGRELFELPVSVQEALSIRIDGETLRGLIAPARSHSSAMHAAEPGEIPPNRTHDNTRSWMFYHHLPNLYPPESVISNARATLRGAARAFHALAESVRDSLAVFMGDQAGYLRRMTELKRGCEGHPLVLNFHGGVPVSLLDDKGEESLYVRLGPHYDRSNFLTLLLNTDVGGLQIAPLRAADKTWMTVEDDDVNSIFVMAANEAAIVTGGRLIPVWHRVVGTVRQIVQPRLSVAYAYSLSRLKPWIDIETGRMVTYRGRPLERGGWAYTLEDHPEATDEKLKTCSRLHESMAERVRAVVRERTER